MYSSQPPVVIERNGVEIDRLGKLAEVVATDHEFYQRRAWKRVRKAVDLEWLFH